MKKPRNHTTEPAMWMPKQALYWLILLVMACSGLTLRAHAGGAVPSPAAAVPSNLQVEDLQSGIRDLLGQLDEIDELHEESAQRALVLRHWQAMQDYARGVLTLLPREPARGSAALSPYGSASSCRLSAGMETGVYVSRVRDLLWTMREQLVVVHETKDVAQRQRLLREHVRGVYQGLRLVRGTGWMHGAAAPVEVGSLPVPDSASNPAYLVRLYCGQCHAPPPTELHSANEWSTVAAKMQSHMNIADADSPQDVRQPTPREMAIILSYLEANGCDVSN